MSFEDKLLNYMREVAIKPLKIDELVRNLGITDKREIKRLQKLLEEMEQKGKIIRTRYGRYGVPDKMNLVVGMLQGNQAGFGFILPDKEELPDVYIPAGQMNGAMHGDHVVARLLKGGGRSREGEIIRILKRRSPLIVGRYESGRQYGFVIPDDQRIFHDIFIPKTKKTTKLKNGMKVQVKITRWPEKRRNPEGKVVEILGFPGDKEVDTLAIIKKYELPERFPTEVLREIKALNRNIGREDLQGREDLRDLPLVTIDGDDAKDLDDAVSLRRSDKGWELGVHIADVGHYVREGTALDREAFNRGTSIYLVDRVIPMLPPELSNDICSLNKGSDRLARSVIMELDEDGNVINYRFAAGVIRVRERLTYDELYAILEEKDDQLRERYREFVPMFEEMAALAGVLRKKRLKRGAIDFNLPEVQVVLADDGKPLEIKKRPRTIAEQIIEEFMLVCNETVAEHFYHLQLPFIYRVHERPAEEKIVQFREFIHNLGYSLKGKPERIHPRVLQELLGEVENRPEERVVNTMLLRAMKQARYSPQRSLHFGLAAEYYTHFTAPIRRYPDLVIHRLIQEYLQGMPKQKRLKRINKFVAEAAERASLRERVAMEAERESTDMKMIEFMSDKIGEEFPAVISGVTAFGLFAELDNLVEGLIHVSSMDDDYYHFHEDKMALIGERSGRTYRIGMPVRVILKRADKENRQIDFILAETD